MRKRLVYSLLVYSLLVYMSTCLPGEAAPQTLTFAFVGDVMLGRGVAQSLQGDWEAAFVDVQPWLSSAGLAFANLESPLTAAPQVADGYDLRAPPAAAIALGAAGFDVVSLANNHTLDAGQAGLSGTLAALESVGIASSFSYSPISNLYLLAFDDSVSPLDLELAKQHVSAAAQQAEWVIVSAHWGGEYQAAPTARQEAIARTWADAGADVIVGHGPHVLQRIEWVDKTLVAYSLGNFLFDQLYPLDCRWGAILRVTVEGGRSVDVQVVPTLSERGRVRLATPDEAAAIFTRLAWTQSQP